MSSHDLFRVIVSLLLGGVIAWAWNSPVDSKALEASGRRRDASFLWGGLLPCYLLAMVGIALVFLGSRNAAWLTISIFFAMLFPITLYDFFLLLLLPLLRRRFSARACAVLWMLPNYLYLYLTSLMAPSGPGLVLSLPGRLVWGLFGVWLTGALLFFCWKVIAHLRFRARLLRGAREIRDPEVLAVWEQELAAANVRKPKFRLVTSPNTASPLSVGLFQRTIRVVLPQRPYLREELSLLLRHELVHVGRQDAWNKFFLLFCTALCWFNPLMWVAMKKSAEDLELSCDEAVLLEADQDTRTRYARLLLDTAGDERGFTTCLSASASSLRYRLQCVVRPGKKWAGGLLLGLVVFGLCMSAGCVTLAWGAGTGAENIFLSQDPQTSSLDFVTRREGGTTSAIRCTDPQALAGYLAQLPMERLAGIYTFEKEDRALFVRYDTPGDVVEVTLWDRAAKIRGGGDSSRGFYYLPQGTDWTYLDRLLSFAPEG